MLTSLMKDIFSRFRSPRPRLPSLRKLGLQDKITNISIPYFGGFIEQQKEERVTALVAELTQSIPSGFHAADNLITWGRNNSMLDDQVFLDAWNKNVETLSDQGIVWRRYILATSAFHCIQLEGDFVECGAYTGVAVKTVMDYLGGTQFPKQFWAYDAFEHEEGMVNDAMPAHGAELFARVQRKFKDYPQVRLVKGLIPEVFESHCPKRICYLHIDMNQAPAEIAALDRLFDRVVPGGMVILDDYEWASYRPQKLAEDNWFGARGYRVMPLPTGQGLVIKR